MSTSGCLGLLKEGFRIEGFAKVIFSQELISGDVRLHSACFFGVFETLVMTFGAMGVRLKFYCFSGLPGGSPELRPRMSGRAPGVFQLAGLPGGTLDLRTRTSVRVAGVFQEAEKQHS